MNLSGSRAVWLVVAAALLPYVNSLDGGFHYDDEHTLVRNPHLRQLSSIPGFFVDSATFSAQPDMAMYRPLLQTSFALNRALSADPWSWHLTNLLVHAAAALGVLALGRRLLPAPAALAAALLFAVHPVQSQVVNYLSSRSEAMAMGFVLWSLVLWVDRRRAASAALLALALLSKSAAVVWWPVAAVVAWRRGERPALRDVGLHGAVTVAYLLLISWDGFLPRSLGQEVRPLTTQLWTQIKGLLYYVHLVFVPRGLSVEHGLVESPQPWGAAVLASALLLLSTVGLALWRRRPLTTTRSGALWFVAALGVPFVVPLNVLINEHRLYLPMAGWALATALPVARFPRLVPVVCVLLGVLAMGQNRLWDNELTLWTRAVERAPRSFRAWSNLGLALHDEGRVAAADSAYTRALHLEPGHARTLNNLGLLREEQGDLAAARDLYRRASARAPRFSGALANLGRLELALGHLEAAERALTEALRRNPRDDEARLHAGRLAVARGRLDEAVGHFERALATAPASPAAATNLGLVAAERGDVTVARRWLQQALVWDPQYADAAVNLFLIEQEAAGRAPGAAYAAALERFPDRGDLARALGDLHAREGAWASAVRRYRQARELGAGPGLSAALARALLAGEQPEAARRAFAEALAEAPDDVSLWNGLAAAAAAAGDLEGARQATREALDRAPDDPRARANTVRLDEALRDEAKGR